jgi:hypothetical protein
MTNQDHLWGVLDDLTELFRESGWPTPEKGYKLDGGWPLALADLKKYIGYDQLSVDQVMAERDAISKRLEQALLAGSELRAERDALASQNARLRAALEDTDKRLCNHHEHTFIMRQAASGLGHICPICSEEPQVFSRNASVLQLTQPAAVTEASEREAGLLALVERLLAALQERDAQIEHLFRHSGRDGSECYDALEVSAAWFRLRSPMPALSLTMPAALEELRRRERSIGAEEELRRLATVADGNWAADELSDRADQIRDARIDAALEGGD